MRTPALPFLALVLGFLALPPAEAGVVPCGPGIPPGVTCLTGNVFDNGGGGPLAAGQVYHLSGFINVPVGQTLTVEAGAILKFHPAALFENRGSLTVEPGVIFTSLADDTAGGDTNADGPSTGSPGDWKGIVNFRTAALDMTEIRFAERGFLVNFDDTTLTGVRIEQCSGPALDLGGNDPTVVGCSFVDNDFAVLHARLQYLPNFVGNTASGNTQGDYVHVNYGTVFQNTVLGPQNSLDGRPLVVCQLIEVPQGVSLELLPGTVIKFGTGPSYANFNCGLEGFEVAGTLTADQVVLTSLSDDTIGGDTAKDGPTFGTPADWGQILFQPTSDASSLEDTLVRFGGKGPGISIAAAIDLLNADVTLTGVDVVECAGTGLRLNAGPGASFPTVTGGSFTDNLGSAVDRVPIPAIAGFTGNAAAGNRFDAMEVAGGVLDGFAAIDRASSLNGDGVFILRGGVTVGAGAELDLGPGVVLKWEATTFSLDVAGTLTAFGTALEPVVLTSLRDDAFAGDTNKDGGDTAPAPGDWTGVSLGVGSGASLLDSVVLRYAGRASQTLAALEVSGAPTLQNSVVELSETAALDLRLLGRPTVVDCDFRDNGGVAVIRAFLAALPGFSGNTATGNVQGDYVHVLNGDVSYAGSGTADGGGGCAVEFGPGSGLAPDVSIVVSDDVDVPAGCQLSILGGAVLKFDGNREFDVDGTLQVGSVGGGTAVFTTAADDSVGGDTLKDGSTEGTPGAWQGLTISGPGTSIQDALVRFAGAFGVAGSTGIALQGANAQLLDVRVEDCLGTGLHLGSNSLPLVDGCSFDRNDLAAGGVPLRALPGFSNSTAVDNKVGDYQRVTDGVVPADLLIQASQALNGGVFVLAAGVMVLPGTTLTLGPNTTFKAESNLTVDVDGTLVANGPVTFTTLVDDINGDTNKDMDATAPVPGSWGGFDFGDGAGGSVLSGLRVRYAGSAGTFGNAPAMRLNGADVTLLDSTLERSGGRALQLAGDARPDVRGTAFDDNQGVPVAGATLGAVQGFVHNTASGNVPGDYLRIDGDAIGGLATVARFNALNGDGVFVVATDVAISAPDELVLRQGVVFKFEGGQRSLVNLTGTLTVEGTGLEPVVLTSVHDDDIGGDTKKDGAASSPSPGDWGRFEVGFGAGPTKIEHLRARFGGGGSFAAIELESEDATARSIRSDHSASDGIRGQRHLGSAVNWVAFGSQGDGIELGSDTFDVVHATVTGNSAVGIRRPLGHVGSLWSSISHGNGGAPVTGWSPGEVFTSNAGPDFAGFDGNIDADPLFQDAAAGDLRLGAGSPCVDAADFAAGLGAAEDHREASRILDDGFDGSFLPDMGAFERAAFDLTFGGEPRLGTVMSFTAVGSEPGLAVYALGLTEGAALLPPFGLLLLGPPGTQLILGTLPTGQPLPVPVPANPLFADLPFGIQAVGLPAASPGAGHATNLYRGRLFP